MQQELGSRLAAAQREAEAARAEAARLGSEAEEARAALEVQHAALQQQLERICAEQEAQLAAAQQAAAAEQQREQQRLAAALADAQHERQVLAEWHSALQDFMEQQQEELAAARVSGAVALVGNAVGSSGGLGGVVSGCLASAKMQGSACV